MDSSLRLSQCFLNLDLDRPTDGCFAQSSCFTTTSINNAPGDTIKNLFLAVEFSYNPQEREKAVTLFKKIVESKMIGIQDPNQKKQLTIIAYYNLGILELNNFEIRKEENLLMESIRWLGQAADLIEENNTIIKEALAKAQLALAKLHDEMAQAEQDPSVQLDLLIQAIGEFKTALSNSDPSQKFTICQLLIPCLQCVIEKSSFKDSIKWRQLLIEIFELRVDVAKDENLQHAVIAIIDIYSKGIEDFLPPNPEKVLKTCIKVIGKIDWEWGESLLSSEYEKQGKFEEAEQWRLKIIALTIEHVGASHIQVDSRKIELAQFYIRRERFDEAQALLKALTKTGRSYQNEAKYELAKLYIRLQQFDEARELLNELLPANSGYATEVSELMNQCL